MQEMIYLDGREMSTREKAHEEIARKMHFPEYYGANLDALWDMLSTCQAEVTLTHAQALMEALGTYGNSIIETFRDADKANRLFSFHEE